MPTMQSFIDAADPRAINQRSAGFLRTADFQPYQDLDGAAARRFLEANGYEVIASGDVQTCGIALTKCGWALSTNGYACYDTTFYRGMMARFKAVKA